MPMFRLIIEDFAMYGCDVEAENLADAQEKFHEELEQKDHDHNETCRAFGGCRDYDGSIEEMWYIDIPNNESKGE